MAHPIGFAEANSILARPAGMSADECASLECFRDGKWCVSRWQLTDEELEELKHNGGKIYVMIRGETQAPVAIKALTPFQGK